MAFQVYAGLALLLYSRWSEMKFHPRTTGFEDGFLSGLTTIEKYAEIALYNVFFLTIALFSFYALLVGAFPGEWFLVFEPATIRTYYPTAAGLLIVGTLTTYFTMLSRFVSISKSSALDRVRRKIQERDAGDKEELLVEEDRIRQSGRWILGIHYGARFLFLTLIVVQGYLANRLFGLLG